MFKLFRKMKLNDITFVWIYGLSENVTQTLRKIFSETRTFYAFNPGFAFVQFKLLRLCYEYEC